MNLEASSLCLRSLLVLALLTLGCKAPNDSGPSESAPPSAGLESTSASMATPLSDDECTEGFPAPGDPDAVDVAEYMLPSCGAASRAWIIWDAATGKEAEHFRTVPMGVENGQARFVMVKDAQGGNYEEWYIDNEYLRVQLDRSWAYCHVADGRTCTEANGDGDPIWCDTQCFEENNLANCAQRHVKGPGPANPEAGYWPGEARKAPWAATLYLPQSASDSFKGAPFIQRRMSLPLNGSKCARYTTHMRLASVQRDGAGTCVTNFDSAEEVGRTVVARRLQQWRPVPNVVFHDVIELKVLSGPGDGERYYHARGLGWVGFNSAYAASLRDSVAMPEPSAAIPDFKPGSVCSMPGNNCVDLEKGNGALCGRFREFWEANGGLPIFGYPQEPHAPANNSDLAGQEGVQQAVSTQRMERYRIELHPENAPPYDVQLGLMGKEVLKQLGRDWTSEPRDSAPQAGCLFFKDTGRNVCDQEEGWGFKAYWEAHGLNLPGQDAYTRSLALFGLPLTAPKMETNPDGDPVLTQWFERARFEWHPQNTKEFRVLLGRLGAELAHPAASDPHTGATGVTVGLALDGRMNAAIERCYQDNGGFPRLGVPADEGRGVRVHAWGNGYAQAFRGGALGPAMCLHPVGSPRAWLVHGAVRERYLAAGGPQGTLGYPVTAFYAGGQGFEHGYIGFEGGVLSNGSSRTVYSSGFEDGVGMEWSVASSETTPVGSRKFLGRLSNEGAVLTLRRLPPHARVTVSFDLYLFNSWDGNGAFGPDVWGVEAVGVRELLRTSFSHTGGAQSYPDSYPAGSHPQGTGAAELNTLGYGFYGDSVYRMSFTFEHTGELLQTRFFAQGLQELGDESWGLDNVKVVVHDGGSSSTEGPGSGWLPAPPHTGGCEAGGCFVGVSWGDPHLVTFDGLGYDFQEAGEFVLVSSSSSTPLMVQIRQQPMGTSRQVAVNTAVAARVGADRVAVYADRSPTLWVNGAAVTPTDVLTLPGGGKVHRRGDGFVVAWPGSDERLVLYPSAGHVDLRLMLPQSRGGQVRGLLGNADGLVGNELATRSGAQVAQPPSFAELHGTLAPSWRVLPAETLFDYAPGTSHGSFDDAAFPQGEVLVSSLSPTLQQETQQVCQSQGVLDPALLQACMLDVALSGDPSYARGASSAPPPRQTSLAVANHDFEAGVGAQWSVRRQGTTPGGRRFLGPLGNETAALSLEALPEHQRATVSFELYVINSWDGNNTSVGPDVWGLRLSDGRELKRTSFSHTGGAQSYPGTYPSSSYAQRTGAAEVNTLGYGVYGDSVYRMSFTFSHTSATLQAQFYAQGLQSLSDESWGVDNVRVVVHRDPPPVEPVPPTCGSKEYLCCDQCIPTSTLCPDVVCPM